MKGGEKEEEEDTRPTYKEKIKIKQVHCNSFVMQSLLVHSVVCTT